MAVAFALDNVTAYVIPATTIVLSVLAMWFQHWRHKRDVERQEFNRSQDIRRSENVARNERIDRVVEAYVAAAQTAQDANERGAIAAGVLRLHDWTECRDFCDRAAKQVARGYEPIRDVHLRRIRPEQLPDYFDAWNHELSEGGRMPDVEKIFASLRSRRPEEA